MSTRGRLKVFFGACSGVGKTFAMLEAARHKRAEGVDVIAGVVETHGRAETAALLAGVPVLPRRCVEYHGTFVEELDLDGALARRPAVILVDELAHENAPGSRHKKRWQDVLELVEAGIDVYTTVNVQHLESLNDVVAQITGVVVRETVPDSVLEQAAEVELVDLPPDELLQRLHDSKVFLGAQIAAATENFFRKGNLIALRELSLRRTAERVDAEMRGYRRDHAIEKIWPAADRIVVCVSASPFSARLVRATARMAAGLRADWIALTIETPAALRLGHEDRERLGHHLALARKLGARTVALEGEKIAPELLAYARAGNVTKIVIGKPTHPRWRDLVFGSVLDDVVRGSGDIDVYVITGEEAGERAPGVGRPAGTPRAGAAAGYAWACLVVALAALAGWIAVPRDDLRYLFTLAVMLVAALVISSLTARIREQAEGARARERRTSALFDLSRELVSLRDPDRIVAAAAEHMRAVFESSITVLLPGPSGRLAGHSDAAATDALDALDAHETAVAGWVFDHGQAAGLGTDTLPSARAMYVPLVGSKGTVGVLGVRPDGPRAREIVDPSRRDDIETFANQTAVALERALLAEEAHRARLLAEAEKLQSSLLSSVSHDLRTPLSAIMGATTALLDESAELDAATRRELAQAAYEEAEHLNRLVQNLLDMTRLESGKLRVKKEWQPLEEVIGAAWSRLEPRLAGRAITTRLPADLPLVPIDGVLVEQVFINLLENALKYTPPGSPLELSAEEAHGEVVVTVADRGPGFLPGDEDRVFEKFFRSEGTGAGGAGLGLAICRGVVAAHGGHIEASNRAGGGARIRFTLPLEGTPPSAESPLLLTEGEASHAR